MRHITLLLIGLTLGCEATPRRRMEADELVGSRIEEANEASKAYQAAPI